MRKCPCCGALAFEDIDTCYECMHPLDANAPSPRQVGKHARPHSDDRGCELRDMRSFETFGDVYCYSIDSSLEAPTEMGYGASWSIEMSQPGVSVATVALGSSHPAVTIGRSRDNDLVITDLRVSRHHARIEFADDALWARDLESKNMTYLDGIPLLGTKRLGDGAELRIGTALLRVSRDPPPSATAAAP